MKCRESWKSISEGLFFAFAVSIIAHYAFSWMGFNPTDEGFTLAYSRRILEGQIPHRDFIIIRPFLSPLLHVPIVKFAGDLTFWLSRLVVWFQFAVIAWIWTKVINKYLDHPFSKIEQIVISLVVFVLNVNIFPVMAWHTIDGLFFASLGLALCTSKNEAALFAGYFVLGLAYLSKQSYLLLAPGFLIILGDWRKLKYWIAIALPGLLYVLLLRANSALPDAIIQLSSQSDLVSIGILQYFDTWQAAAGVASGLVFARGLNTNPPKSTLVNRSLSSFTSALLFFVPVFLGLIWPGIAQVEESSFLFFGLLIGLLIGLMTNGRNLSIEKETLHIFLIIILVAWSSSISFGYASPGLTSGIMVAGLMAFSFKNFPDVKTLKKISTPLLLSICLIAFVTFATARNSNVYRDQSSSNLLFPLDEILSGGDRIKTNENTADYLLDLQLSIQLAQNGGDRNYIILPDNAAYWVTSQQLNPLPIDWPLNAEINSPRLFARVTSSIESQSDNLLIIVQKVKADALANGFSPLDEHNRSIVKYVTENFILVGESKYFEWYFQEKE